jgi:hypothetical protein
MHPYFERPKAHQLPFSTAILHRSIYRRKEKLKRGKILEPSGLFKKFGAIAIAAAVTTSLFWLCMASSSWPHPPHMYQHL